MPSTSFSARRRAATGAPERPLAVPFAAGFGALTAVEVLFLGALMWLPDPRMDRVTVVTLLLVAAASAGSLMVLQGRRGGWLLLATAAVGTLAALFLLALVLGALGLTVETWSAVLLAVGPVVSLVLALQRPVRTWTGRDGTRRSAGGRRGAADAR